MTAHLIFALVSLCSLYATATFSATNYWTVWQTQLEKQIQSMQSDWRELRAQREKAAAWVNQIQEGDRNSDMLKQQFNIEMNFAIRQKMADIRFDLVNLETDRAQSALQNLQDESQTFLAESSLQLDSLVYEQQLARERDAIVDEAIVRIGEIRRSGSLDAFRSSFFPLERGETGRSRSRLVADVGYQRLYFTHAERSEDFALVQGMITNNRRLSTSFGKIAVGHSVAPMLTDSQTLTPSDFAPGVIDEKEALWQAAAIELQMAQAKLRNYENVRRVGELERQDEIFNRSAAEIQQEIDQLREQYESNQEAERKNVEVKIQDSLLDRATKVVDHAKAHVKRTEESIQKFRDYIVKTREMVQQIKDWGKRAEQAYDIFKSITEAFSTTPATLAGPMGGPIVDPAGSFERKGRSALDRIKAVYQNLVQSQSFDELLNKLDKEAETMQSNLAALRVDADNRVQELKQAVLSSDLKYVLAVPKGEVFQGINAKVAAIKQQGHQKLEDELARIHDEFRQETRGTLLEKPLDQITTNNFQKAKIQVEALDKVIQQKLDVAFEQARTRFVSAMESIDAWREEEQTKVEKERQIRTDTNPTVGRVFAENMKQKAEAEYRLEQAEIQRAALAAEKQDRQKELNEFEQQQLAQLVKAAEQREIAARAAMVSAIVDQETAWLRLVNTAIRWNRANDQAAELSSQFANIKLTS